MPDRLSLTGKHWRFSGGAAPTSTQTIMSMLSTQRKLTDAVKPGVYPQIEQATARIHTALQHNERIGIFGDYDCDGITGTAIVLRALRRHGADPVVRLPHRMHDGYGLRSATVDWFIDQNIDLLITVDTGIASVAEVATLQAKGIDVIITDHHHCGAELPPAHSIVHPAIADDFPLPHPAGAGVALALVEHLENNHWEDQATDQALAMIGTVADLVPLQGNNRQLVQQGLAALQSLQDGALAELRDQTKAVSSTDVAFRIAPRINAAGRMTDPTVALSALLQGGEHLALLDTLNSERQDVMRSLFEQAESTLDTSQPLLWSADAEYPHGIIGLIAGRLTERYGRPSCVVTIDGDTCTASLRSPTAYHITDGLSRISSLLTTFGGHAQAAGCSFERAHLAAVQTQLMQDITTHTDAADLVPEIVIDGELSSTDINLDLLTALQSLEPYGQGNPEPVFLLRGVTLDYIRRVGSDQSHLQCKIGPTKAIGFGIGDLQSQITNCPVDVACRLTEDTWTGRRLPQLQILDVRQVQKEPATAGSTAAL